MSEFPFGKAVFVYESRVDKTALCATVDEGGCSGEEGDGLALVFTNREFQV
jgi:hypothetical protein